MTALFDAPVAQTVARAPMMSVVGASPGIGVSSLVWALATAAADEVESSTVFDASPPYLSGLYSAAPHSRVFESPSQAGVHLVAGQSQESVWLLRLSSSDPVMRDQYFGRHRVPPVGEWRAIADHVGATGPIVVDFGWPPTESLFEGTPLRSLVSQSQATVLVVAASTPSVARAEHTIEALRRTHPNPPLIVLRVRSDRDVRWVRDCAGSGLHAALERQAPVCVGDDASVFRGGPEVVSKALSKSAHQLLDAAAVISYEGRRRK
jgi:hypothetical protein